MDPMKQCPSCQRWNKSEAVKCWKCGEAMDLPECNCSDVPLPDRWTRTFVVATDFTGFVKAALGYRDPEHTDMVLVDVSASRARAGDGTFCYKVTLAYRRLLTFGKITPEPFPVGPFIPSDWREVERNSS